MTERVDPVLLPGQRLIDGTGRTCTGCGHQFADGEKAICTPPSWPDTRKPAIWTCAACYRPPGPPGRNERLTERTSHGAPPTSAGSLTSWSWSSGAC